MKKQPMPLLACLAAYAALGVAYVALSLVERIEREVDVRNWRSTMDKNQWRINV
jgi:hypothetical protein